MMTRRQIVLGSLAGTLYLQIGNAAETGINGHWAGVLNVGSKQLRLRIEIDNNSIATLYSLDQDNTPIKGQFKSSNEKIQMEWSGIKAEFVGRMISPDQIEGMWQQDAHIPLVLSRGDVAPVVVQHWDPLTTHDLESLRRDAGAPALAAAAIRRGGRNLLWATGKREINGPTPVTTEDQWHFGSITKSMTATLIARLVDAGAVTWDDSVGEILKEVAPNMHEQYKSVTLKHLLCHRSGMPANLTGLGLANFAVMSDVNILGQRRLYTREALAMTPTGPKEATYLYSNNGYVVAATMLETKLGKSWEELITSYVFEPLALKSVGFGAPNAGGIGKLKQPIGHMTDLGSRIVKKMFGATPIRGVHEGFGYQTDNPHVLGPAARVHMTLTDMLKYLEAHRDQTSFLKRESWQTLHTPPFGGDYAMGWMVRPDGNLWHNGSNTMWYAEVMFNSRSGVSAVAACNEDRVPATIAVGKALMTAASAAQATRENPT